MKGLPLHLVAACVAALALWGCGKEQPSPGGPAKTAAPKVVEEAVPPYTYPAPVKGHYKEINLGEFDLVDGIAYPATGGRGTVIYVTSKPIASPVVAGSACPMTQARALSQLRDVSYLEVTIANGRSNYFVAGKSFGGSSREGGSGREWSSTMKTYPDRASGGVTHKLYGSFNFDLPLSSPKVNEVSEGDWIDDIRADATAPKPTEQALTATYQAVHDAALKKNLKGVLAAQGFDAKEIAAIRGLDGIDADFEVYSERFLVPSAPAEFSASPGTGYTGVKGSNAKGKKFANYYHFAPCGDHLVLVSIAENPQ